MNAPVPLLEIIRSDFVEGHHYGSVVVLDRGGEVEWSVGAVDVPMLPRSCVKPLQAVAMVREGLTSTASCSRSRRVATPGNRSTSRVLDASSPTPG